MTEEKNTDTRLSYSSATLLKNCSQKYHYHKISQTGKDSDAEENYDAFNIGKAFHWVLETNGHTDEELEELLLEASSTFEVEKHEAMIHAMLLRYLQVHKKSGLEVVFCELLLNAPDFIGFVDVILQDSEGYWWISDLKTAARVPETTFARLKLDPQLNLYSYFADWIALELGLDIRKFKGARYRATTKSVLKRRPTESYGEFVRRMAKNIKSYDIIVPIEEMVPGATMEEHKRLHRKTMAMREGKVKPEKNLNYCDSFFKPCEYWSQCYGKNFSDMKNDLEVIGSDNV